MDAKTMLSTGALDFLQDLRVCTVFRPLGLAGKKAAKDYAARLIQRAIIAQFEGRSEDAISLLDRCTDFVSVTFESRHPIARGLDRQLVNLKLAVISSLQFVRIA